MLRVERCNFKAKKKYNSQWSSKENTSRPQIHEMSEDPRSHDCLLVVQFTGLFYPPEDVDGDTHKYDEDAADAD